MKKLKTITYDPSLWQVVPRELSMQMYNTLKADDYAEVADKWRDLLFVAPHHPGEQDIPEPGWQRDFVVEADAMLEEDIEQDVPPYTCR